jgi:hypothetical protein
VAVDLLTHGRIAVPRLLRREARIPQPIARTVSCLAPNKPTLLFEGTATWAEIVIIRLLERAGWEARWLKNWIGGRETCVSVGEARPLPDVIAAKLSSIDTRSGITTGGGAWDVLAWRESEFLCIESKQHRSSDKLRLTQLLWLDAALSEGVTRFAIVEYEAIEVADPAIRSSAAPMGIAPSKPVARERAGRPPTAGPPVSGVLDAAYAAEAPAARAASG